jgi:predicted DNA-binding protein (MmcQ/YjbR family)
VSVIERVRALALALPEAFEVEAWQHPTFRVGGGKGKMFCMAAGERNTDLWFKADPGERVALLAQGDPYFLPPYMGPRGWGGVHLDDPATDWEEVAELIATAYCLTAPKRLAKLVTEPPSLSG